METNEQLTQLQGQVDALQTKLNVFEDVVRVFRQNIEDFEFQQNQNNFSEKQVFNKELLIKNKITVGVNDDVAILSGSDATWRLWVGHRTPTSAPFRVDKDGNVTASSITLSGYVQVGGSASDVNSGAGTINASKINASTLSAISANLGTITAGSLSAVTITGSTVTGTTLTTATSGQRTVLTSSLVTFYNSSGTAIVDMFASSSTLLVDGATSSSIIALDSGSSGALVFRVGSTTILNIGSTGLTPTSGADATYDIGASSLRWRDGHFSRDVSVGDDLFVGNDIFVTDGSIEIVEGFVNLAQMTGATADARVDDENGAMYYRTDDDTIRVKLNGTWKTVTTS